MLIFIFPLSYFLPFVVFLYVFPSFFVFSYHLSRFRYVPLWRQILYWYHSGISGETWELFVASTLVAMLSAQYLAQFIAVKQDGHSVSWDMNFDALGKCYSGLRTIFVLSKFFVFERAKCEYFVFSKVSTVCLTSSLSRIVSLFRLHHTFPILAFYTSVGGAGG